MKVKILSIVIILLAFNVHPIYAGGSEPEPASGTLQQYAEDSIVVSQRSIDNQNELGHHAAYFPGGQLPDGWRSQQEASYVRVANHWILTDIHTLTYEEPNVQLTFVFRCSQQHC